MPAYQAQTYIGGAIGSVLRQDYGSIELIVIDDGSTDNTLREARRAALEGGRAGATVRIIEQANAGAAAARNAGLQAATGDYIGFIDADDVWLPGLATCLVGRLAADETLDLVFPTVAYMNAANQLTGDVSIPKGRRFSAAELLVRNPIHTASGVIVRASAALQVGSFDNDLRAAIDFDFWLRIARLRPASVGHESQVLVRYRKHDGQITSDWRRMRRGFYHVLAKTQAEDPHLIEDVRRKAEANKQVYWATIAYQAGRHEEARRLIIGAFAKAPFLLVRDAEARIRLAACAATLAPSWARDVADKAFARRRAKL